MFHHLKKGMLLGIVALLSTIRLPAQSQYAKKMVDTLTAPTFWGRGYTKDGMKKAAVFIASEMRAIGLEPVPGATMLQAFRVTVNTFPGKMSLTINGKKLKAGKDYIVSGNSRGLKGSYTLRPTQEKGAYANSEPEILIQVQKKLTWSPSTYTGTNTHIIVKDTLSSRVARIKTDIGQTLITDLEAFNVCGMISGTERPDSFLVLTAHYDHLGGMGDDTYFPGANDNASGVALMLELAKYYAKNPAKYSVIFIAFGAEEIGLKGSQYFVDHPTVDLSKIRFLLNLDLMGNGEDGMAVVNATNHPDIYGRLVAWNANNKIFKEVTQRDNAANSDHYPFTQKGVPAFFIYTLGGTKAYHDIYDVPATLPLSYFPHLGQMIRDLFKSF